MFGFIFKTSFWLYLFPEKIVITFLSILSTKVGLSSVELTSGKTVLILNDDPTYFASLNFGKNLLPEFKNESSLVIDGFFIKPLSSNGRNFSSIFGSSEAEKCWFYRRKTIIFAKS